ncbi:MULTISPECIES: ABC transporter substrate-binding protein [Syntrophotalea]|jgi:iron complex transport system substrate-binding protein|nr:ABC transporter substrate-binding protein [Syntrophotalea acetylenica]APG42886.1 hypothetical protein A6070_01125 [Syntrophotalea acetylenica]MDY0261363.1 ABC transporter substrate-binding protein [Syntrophotalea acetylenica]
MAGYLTNSMGRALWCMMLVTLIATGAGAREIVDMTGRRIDVPEPLQRVYVASPPESYLACAIDPSLLVGLTLPLPQRYRRYLPEAMTGLPVVGGFFGVGNAPNLEALVKTRPQLVICWQKTAVSERFDKFLRQFGIPVAHMTLQRLQDYPRDIRGMGRILGRPQRAEQLAAYAEKTLGEILPRVASMPASERVRVYYAEGADGLSTDGRGTWHAELIDLAGGLNVHKGEKDDLFGMEKISLEQVLLYRPEVILVHDPVFFRKIFLSPRWRNVPAVKNRRVYLIPRIPFNWFDRPPSFMRLLGLQWVAQVLYPRHFNIDMPREMREFYRLFLRVHLSDEDIRLILESREVPEHG